MSGLYMMVTITSRKHMPAFKKIYRENQVDAAVLGCTHYPFARKQIQQVLGENVKIFDGGEGTAREMKRRLQEKDLLCGRQKRGQVVFENSLTDDSKIELCKKLLNI